MRKIPLWVLNNTLLKKKVVVVNISIRQIEHCYHATSLRFLTRLSLRIS
jgi:hypothetical protein